MIDDVWKITSKYWILAENTVAKPVTVIFEQVKLVANDDVVANDAVCAFTALVAFSAYEALVALTAFVAFRAYDALNTELACEAVTANDAVIATTVEPEVKGLIVSTKRLLMLYYF